MYNVIVATPDSTHTSAPMTEMAALAALKAIKGKKVGKVAVIAQVRCAATKKIIKHKII